MKREENASMSTLFEPPVFPKAKQYNVGAGSPNLIPLRAMNMTFNAES